MKEISNITLALLVVGTMIVSVFGTFISLNKITQFNNLGGVTGLALGTGIANLTVPESTTFELDDSLIELRELSVSTDSVNNTNTSESVDDWWILRNVGTVNISIRIYSHASSDQNVGGPQVAGRGPFTSSSVDKGCLNSSD
jgi:hypothetical protein